MKKRVLVFPCGSEIGLEVYKAVKDSTHFELIGLSSVNDHGKFVYENYIQGISFFNHESFPYELYNIVRKENIDIIYPTMDRVITKIKKLEKNLKVSVVGPDFETCEICENKEITYNVLKNLIRVPQLYKIESLMDLPFPLFSKPKVGYGSRGSCIVTNHNDLNNYNPTRDLLTEYLPGKEYTIDCFTDLMGNLIFIGARERNRTMNGISVNTRTDKKLTRDFTHIAESINNCIKFKGSWFFQMKRDKNDNLVLLEIACRFAGSSSVHRAIGVNFPLANLFLAMNKNIKFIANEFDVELDRSLDNKFKFSISFESIYIDFDDTIIINQKVNPEAISFLYKCLNLNKKIHLITKHEGDIYDSLNKYKIDKLLFNTIVHLKKNEEKSDYILHNNIQKSIFIDDSFEERKKILINKKVPVFSIDLISSIL